MEERNVVPCVLPLLRDGEIVYEFDFDAAIDRAASEVERVGFDPLSSSRHESSNSEK